jgi:hypothetical protein
VEYGKNGLGFKKQHNKMENVWEHFTSFNLEKSDAIWATIA